MCDQSVASMKSSAYLIEPDPPSQLAAFSIPAGPNLPSYRPIPGPVAADPPADAPVLDHPVVALTLGLPDGEPPHAAVRMAVPAITRMASMGFLLFLRGDSIMG